MTLDSDERRVLDVLVADQPESVTEFVKLVSPFPNYKTILERINEKALDFYEEIIINTDEMLPYVEEDYLDELKEQHDVYYDKNKADLMIEEQRRLAEERSARLVDELKNPKQSVANSKQKGKKRQSLEELKQNAGLSWKKNCARQKKNLVSRKSSVKQMMPAGKKNCVRQKKLVSLKSKEEQRKRRFCRRLSNKKYDTNR